MHRLPVDSFSHAILLPAWRAAPAAAEPNLMKPT